jgi:predicted negative regulator of RcsB-dependent stress response
MAGKITKQELKEPDKFQVMLAKILTYLTENKQRIFIASGILTVILLMAGGWYIYSLHYEKSAQQIYARAYASSSADNAAAVNTFKEVISTHPRSHAAAMSHYRLAAVYYGQNDLDAAIQAYEAFLRITPEGNDLKPLAYTGLGYCYESKKDLKNALANFEKAAGLKAGQVFEGMNHQNIARVYEAMNDRAKALEHYQKALGKNVDSSSELLIKRKIATLS